VKFAFIRAHRDAHEVATLCRVLGVSKAGYYAWVKRAPSARATEDRVLAAAIRAVHQESGRTYGSPRVHRELRDQGRRHGVKRIARVMRTEGLRAKTTRRFRVTTQPDHAHPVAPNVLARRFGERRPDRVWVADITYLHTREGWLYLAVVLDLATRAVVGWRCATPWSAASRWTRSTWRCAAAGQRRACCITPTVGASTRAATTARSSGRTA
jgi:hypothetical protein